MKVITVEISFLCIAQIHVDVGLITKIKHVSNRKHSAATSYWNFLLWFSTVLQHMLCNKETSQSSLFHCIYTAHLHRVMESEKYLMIYFQGLYLPEKINHHRWVIDIVVLPVQSVAMETWRCHCYRAPRVDGGHACQSTIFAVRGTALSRCC